MGQPTTTELLLAANAAYLADPTSPDPATGEQLTILTDSDGSPVQASNVGHGFHGVALETASDQVIIAFEGTAFRSLSSMPTFVGAQLQDDKMIALGQNPPAYADALAFAQTAVAAAEAQGVDPSDIFVAGHSLGGAEAEYVAANTGLAGDTFGAPGLPSADLNTGLASQLTNYVEYGDPVGNYSNGPDIIGNLLLNPDVERYGQATYIGGSYNRPGLAEAGQLFVKEPTSSAQVEVDVAAVGVAIADFAYQHQISDYAATLGVSLPVNNISNVTVSEVEAALAYVTGGTGGVASAAASGVQSSSAELSHPVGPSPVESLLSAVAHPNMHLG